ncbi:MAG TPA: hypothetical protein VK787_13095 [Puia sp.]|nr:hypothetical protein [Puia sp.]
MERHNRFKRPKKHLSFGSEIGQDEYYILYAYFLKKKNNKNNFEVRRNTLIKIYNDINEIFGMLSYGGTYFGHQGRRIIGYAEYSIYLYSQNEEDYKKKYDISKQKKFYINSLKQFIVNEESADVETVNQRGKRKTKIRSIYKGH